MMSQNQSGQPLTLGMLQKELGGPKRKLRFLDSFFPADLLYAQPNSDPAPKASGTKTADHSSPVQQKGTKPTYTKHYIPYTLAKDGCHSQDKNLDGYYQVLFGNKSPKGNYSDAIGGLRKRIANTIVDDEHVIPQIREHMRDKSLPNAGEVIHSLRNAAIESKGLQVRFHSLLKEIEQEEEFLRWLAGNAGSVPLDELKEGLDSRAESFAWLSGDPLNEIKSVMNIKSFVNEATSQFTKHMHTDEENAFLWLLLGALLQDQIVSVAETYDAHFVRVKPAPKAPAPRQSEPAPSHKLPDEITMQSEERILTPDYHVPLSDLEGHWIPRRERMEEITKGLVNASYRPVILLSGAGGSGKTELVRMVVNQTIPFKSVLWLTYSKLYRSTGENKTLYQLMEDCALSNVKNQLPSWGRDCLIVVDNLDVQDNVLMRDLLDQYLTGDARILITTRDKTMFLNAGNEYPEHLEDNAELSSICLNDHPDEQAETAVKLFQSCCPQDCKDEKLLIPEICARLDNNLLLVSYLAKNTKSAPSQILSDLNRLPVLNPAGALRNLGRVSHHYQTVDKPEALIRYVFGDLLDDRRFADKPLQAQALALLALLPGAAVDQDLAAALLGDGEGTLAAEDLSALEKADLLRKSGEGRVTLHSLMAEILLSYQPAVQALMKDAAFWGQILENWLTMKRSSTTPALIYAVLSHVYTLGEDVCAAQRLALLIEQGNPDELFRKLHPAVPGAILACAEHKTERRFVWWDLQKRQEETILRAQHQYHLNSAQAEPLLCGQNTVRFLHLYFAPYPDASLPLVIPDWLGDKPVTEIPAQFCTKADPEMFEHITDRYRAGRTAFFSSLQLPRWLTVIGDDAFASLWVSQQSLQLPSTLREIGDRAFAGCQFTGRLELPDSLARIGRHAFADNLFYGDLRLPEKLSSLGDGAFQNSGSFGDLSSDEIDALKARGVTIDDLAFEKNGTALQEKETVIQTDASPEKLREEITTPVICEENGKTVIRFDDSLHDLRQENLPGMLEGRLELPDCCLTAIRSHALYRQKGISGDLAIPKSVLRIEMFAFSDCGLDGTVTVKGKPVIEMGAFSFTNIKKVIFEQDAQEIGHAVFEGCRHLTIYAPPDSAAARYAQANGIPFIPLK